MFPPRESGAGAGARDTAGHASFAPVQPGERIQTIDVLRGFALFGVLWMNTPTNLEPVTAFDRGVQFLGNLLADGKFISLYSFLFGLGFSVQLLRAEQRGAWIVPVYLRRLAVLLLIGVAHSILLWHGDILQNYAVLGVLLLLLKNRSPRFLLALAALCLAYHIFSTGLSGPIGSPRRPEPEAERAESLQAEVRDLDYQVWWQRVFYAADNATYASLVAARAPQRLEQDSNPWEWFDGMIFSMFLLGLYAGRRGIFQNPSAHLPFIRRVMWWGLGVGMVCNLASATGSELGPLYHFEFPGHLGDALYTIGRPALCLFYASALTLLIERGNWKGRLSPLSWAGRMGLTNYLLQSLIFTTVFYHYGFGLISKASAPLALLFTVPAFVLQILLSKWWMARFQYGPMEWLWRSLTYLRRQPMRVARA